MPNIPTDLQHPHLPRSEMDPLRRSNAPDGRARPSVLTGVGSTTRGVQEAGEHLLRLAAERLDQGDELDDVEPSLAVLDLGDEGLRSPEPLGDGGLGQLGFPTRRDEQVEQGLVLGRADGLGHVPARCEDADDADPKIGLSHIRIFS